MREKIFKKFDKNKVFEVKNLSSNKVKSSKKNIIPKEVPKQYKEKYQDEERENLISQLFFFETQIYYLEKALEEERNKNNKNEEKLKT